MGPGENGKCSEIKLMCSLELHNNLFIKCVSINIFN